MSESDDREWDESTADQRVSGEFTVDLLKALLDRGVSMATAQKAARESLAAAKSGNEYAKRKDYYLDAWLKRNRTRT